MDFVTVMKTHPFSRPFFQLLIAAITLVVTGCLGTSSETTIMYADTTDTGPDLLTTVSADVSPADTAEAPMLEPDEVPAAEPTAAKVVTLGSAIKPGGAAPGAVVTLAVRVRIAEPWHIYAVNKPTGVSIPTKLKLKLPEGVTRVGEWKIPDPKEYEEGVFVYEKDVVFQQQVKIGDNASGLLNVGCEVKYQPCNDQSCKAPTSATTTVAIEVTE